ncbi:MAG: hydrogenase maturation protease, partial [Desulfobacteraceae bacterium]|jgi:hydrogenase maturation protease
MPFYQIENREGVGTGRAFMPQERIKWGVNWPKSGTQIIIVGIGNEYRGDDDIGPFIARKLQTMNLPRTHVKVQNGEGTSLMESWKGADMVILLDAVNSGATPGKTYRLSAHTEPIPSGMFNYSTHNFSVVEAVELARTLKQLPPCLIIYGIEGKSFGEGTGISPEVKKAAEDVMKRVIQDVYEALNQVIRPVVGKKHS